MTIDVADSAHDTTHDPTGDSSDGVGVDPEREPLSPQSVRRLPRWLWRLARDVVGEWQEDGLGDQAASITFWTVLSIPAGALALVSALSSLGSIIGESLAAEIEAEVQTYVANTLVDSEALSAAIASLFDESNRGIVTGAALVAFFTLSRAFAGLIRSLDVAYEVHDGRSWWHLRVAALGLGVGTVVVVAVATGLLAILPSLPFGSVLRWLAAPIAFVALVAWAATVFHIGPYHRTPWRYEIPGAVVTALGWVAASQGFAVYVRFVGTGDGNRVQTTVGAVLLGLTLLYLLSVVLLVGAEVNDVLARRAGVVQQPITMKMRAAAVRNRVAGRRHG